jgi:hypothetical protein
LANEPDSTAGHNNAVTQIGNLRALLLGIKNTKKAAAITVAIADADEARNLIPSKAETAQAKEAEKESAAKKAAPIVVETDLGALVKLVPTSAPLHEVLQAVLEAERAYAKKPDEEHAKTLRDTAARVSLFVDKLDPGDPDRMIAQAIIDETTDVLSPLTAPASYVAVEAARWNHEREDLRKVEIAVLQAVLKIDRKSGVYRRAVETAIALRNLTRDPFDDNAKRMLHEAARALEIILEAMPEESADRLLGAKIAKAAHAAAGPERP